MSSFVSNGWPADVLDIESDRLVLRPFLRDSVTVQRRQVRGVEFRRQRLPFMWRTFIAVRLDAGYLPSMFIAWRKSKVRDELVKLGWNVEDGPNVTFRNIMLSPRPQPDT